MNDNNEIVKTNETPEEKAFALAQRKAKLLASSDLLPKQYQNNLPNCMILIEMADLLGANVMQLAQNTYVVHNKPALSSSFLIATVNASKRFSPLRFRFEGEEGKLSWGCRAVATDKESGEECVGTLITLQMAKDEGWSTKNGSKWKTMAEQMLQYRAAAFWQRIYCPELSLGMHTTEEIIDIGTAEVVQRQPTLKEFTEQLIAENEQPEHKDAEVPEPPLARHPSTEDETSDDDQYELTV